MRKLAAALTSFVNKVAVLGLPTDNSGYAQAKEIRYNLLRELKLQKVKYDVDLLPMGSYGNLFGQHRPVAITSNDDLEPVHIGIDDELEDDDKLAVYIGRPKNKYAYLYFKSDLSDLDGKLDVLIGIVNDYMGSEDQDEADSVLELAKRQYPERKYDSVDVHPAVNAIKFRPSPKNRPDVAYPRGRQRTR